MNKDLTVGKPESVLCKFCLPLFGSIIFQQLYNIADRIILVFGGNSHFLNLGDKLFILKLLFGVFFLHTYNRRL